MFGDFKKIVKKGEKYIVVENGKPEYVVMHYDDYAEMISRKEPFDAAQGKPLDVTRGGPLDYARGKQPENAMGDLFDARTILAGSNLPEDISKIRLEDLPL